MSHLTSVQTQFKNVAALKAACNMLGWEFHENRPVRYYRGPGEMCDFVMEFGDQEDGLGHTYNLGFQKQQDGTYKLLCDNSMRGPMIYEEGKLGGQTPRILNKLKQQYARTILTQKAAQMGASVKVQQQADGSLVMELQSTRFGRNRGGRSI